MTRRRNNNFSKTIKDYLVPLIWLFLIMVLAWSIFGGTEKTVEPNTNNGIGLEVNLDSPSTEADIVYEWDYKTAISGSAKLFKWEKVLVKVGAVNISLDGIGDFKLDKLGELKYNIWDDFTLFSSNLWFSSDNANTINLQFWNSVAVGTNSTVSISQNDVQATVYLLNGSATVYSSTGKELSLSKWEQITLSRKDSIDEDIDLSLLKKEFGEFFKVSDWYIKNNGDFFLNQWNLDTASGSVSISGSGSTSAQLTSVFDESTVSSSPIKLEWRYNPDTTSRITINNIATLLDESSKSFKIDQFKLALKTNDLVVKVYNTDGSIESKQVYTVYYSGGNDTSTSVAQAVWIVNVADGTVYGVDATKFGFTAPSTSGKFATTGSEITIRGITTAADISKVMVDWFELKSFNGSTWRYHAFTRFDNLILGNNQYEIQYFWKDGNLVYTDYYTIVKKTAGSIPAEVISDEVQL